MVFLCVHLNRSHRGGRNSFGPVSESASASMAPFPTEEAAAASGTGVSPYVSSSASGQPVGDSSGGHQVGVSSGQKTEATVAVLGLAESSSDESTTSHSSSRPPVGVLTGQHSEHKSEHSEGRPLEELHDMIDDVMQTLNDEHADSAGVPSVDNKPEVPPTLPGVLSGSSSSRSLASSGSVVAESPASVGSKAAKVFPVENPIE